MNCTRKTCLASAALALIAPLSAAQEPERPPLPSERLEQQDAQQRLRELFAKVERNLRQIDTFLSDAAAGDVPLELPEDSGLDELLRQTGERSRQTIDDIDQILEIARQQQQQQGGQGGGSSQRNQGSESQPQQQGESPLDEQRGGERQQPEQTPELPGQGEEGPQPQPEDGQPGQEQPQDGGESPDDTPENRPGTDPPGSETGPGQENAADGARWGELPPRVREIFRSQGGGDLPVQYRDWIDSYYRRLNRRR